MTLRKLGFSGTSGWLPDAQKEGILRVLSDKWYEGFRQLDHGDCVSADWFANDAARALGYRTKAHPPIKEAKRAFCTVDEEAEPKDFLVRDEDIARETEELVAAPPTYTEIIRDGTWTTIRRARKYGRKITLILPDGQVVPDEKT